MNALLQPSIPRPVAWLGYGGLLPFIALALISLIGLGDATHWTGALIAYGAVILSFVGALHWGFAMTLQQLDQGQRTHCFVWSTLPALLAWPALLLPPVAAAAVLITGFVAHYLQDRRLARHAPLPAWYLPLRLQLTSVASLCLGFGLIAT